MIATNPYFGGGEETGLLITISDLYGEKIKRHVTSYASQMENEDASC